MQFPRKGAVIFQPLPGKVRVSILIFESGLCLPTSDFFDQIMQEYAISMDNLTPNAMNKIVGFELACRAIGVIP